MINLYTSFIENPFVTIFLLLAIFAFVALLANWIRKFIWPDQINDKAVDPKKAVQEELDRVLVPIKEPLSEKVNQVSSSKASPKKSVNPKPKKPVAKNARKRNTKAS
jgi:cell shape-determining protein MreC